MTTTDCEGIRKTAILVAGLSGDAADRLLDQFDAESARCIRQAVVELAEIDPAEQEKILREFVSIGLSDGEPAALRQVEPEARPAPADDRPFAFLRNLDAERIAWGLAPERPTVIAFVLSHLPSDRAGAALSRLEAGVQVEVVRRLVDLEETDPIVAAEVEQALEQRFAAPTPTKPAAAATRRSGRLATVAGILEAAQGQGGSEILHHLASRDRALAEKLAQAPLEFEDLLAIDSAGWAAILEIADPELALLALIDAEEDWLDHALARVPMAKAADLRKRLSKPGPVRLRDVEDARRELAALARRLAVEGRIQVGPDTAPRLRVAV